MTDTHTTADDDVTVLLEGLQVGESPRWHDGRLWFCHWGADEVVAVAPDGTAEVVLHDPDIQPHSIDWLPDGRMLIVSRAERWASRLLRREHDGTIAVHADLGGVAGGFNEIVVHPGGDVYVNGSDFDFLGWLQGRAEFVPGRIALVTRDGEVRAVADDIQFGNGMVITPDGRTLVLADSFAGTLVAFDIEADGSLTGRRTWAEGLSPDGITIDDEGAVWTSTGGMEIAGGILVRVRDGGEITHRLEIDRNPFACMLGGEDGRTLHVMAARFDPQDPFGGPATGRVLTIPAPAPRAGRP
ncbi:SMP-30/gluconolactonase/LRE family protein [Actinomycetospora straminea]|uniref:SMP-30/gluconolactonase/LRE family protein n=1 Tax=Actinomycetospora straminea TaxID=663607 RepID=A0ABP9E4K0_9PSEU|nr:SMP-30/gluconolactonase/LRE family protein [Actinomycetospora straminea]MDD7936784.1 SMP-30/gluconolactonase/LRE family protein [Actinomycetospora straminea]